MPRRDIEAGVAMFVEVRIMPIIPPIFPVVPMLFLLPFLFRVIPVRSRLPVLPTFPILFFLPVLVQVMPVVSLSRLVLSFVCRRRAEAANGGQGNRKEQLVHCFSPKRIYQHRGLV